MTCGPRPSNSFGGWADGRATELACGTVPKLGEEARMTVVPENERLDALRRLGLSGPLVRLAAGKPVHPAFGFRCQAPPRYSYHGAGCPGGPPLTPLWDCGDTVTAVWERDGRPEFIEFCIEADGEFWVLAATEQGLWATVFTALVEDRDDLGADELRDAAQVVGFRFLDRVVAGRQEADLSTFEQHAAWLQGLVAGIDRESR